MVWTSDAILHNTRIPESLAVIGVGAIGLEFSLRYARLGSAVTLVSRSDILPEFPSQFGERIASIYQHEGIRVLTHRHVARIGRDQSGAFTIETEGAESIAPIVCQRILLATGRR
ncbi:MAG TPA: FAD-dependent oxidoreductase, partial [Chthoniobacteraceae bacterium]|nr:FAD-dependent oxidoreductase [Chthoniobacteraceae bacterium]